ncbi:GLPGLI family protein [Flavihumibacter petaseus]|uniref:GLPGLI family protein n=1 Tax=Flavihumibacter petaseus NBRC 106054 TaxID=1220578 RepID=A0A0E9N6A8_9BACT|nr:GLPGLI family protein [Flavihumibacter petaseus]GAO45348.1 hypothetical protein FPE01S_05_00450 [Flavihumibacter petaseus NBRC 106054]
MKKIVLFTCFVAVAFVLRAQQVFVSNGVIEYERKINVHRQFEMDEEGSDFFKDFISKQPKFHNSYFNLTFNRAQSIYQPGREADVKMEPWMVGPAKTNVVTMDFKTDVYTSRRRVFEENFEITDSLAKVHWKLSNETREIAGFECRKAVGVICDSVYVVAFYTEEIPVSGGPESFGGLPGMILGLAVPRLYTTWFATKVELSEPAATAFATGKPGKSKKLPSNQLAPVLTSTFSDWGKRGQKFIWWSML